MFERIVPIVLLSGLTLTAGIAAAAGVAYPTNPERSLEPLAAPSPRTRAEVLLELEQFRKDRVSPDGWQYVGGERDWIQIPHGYRFSGGKLVHSDSIDHNAPKPSARLSDDEKIQSLVLYRNAP